MDIISFGIGVFGYAGFRIMIQYFCLRMGICPLFFEKCKNIQIGGKNNGKKIIEKENKKCHNISRPFN